MEGFDPKYALIKLFHMGTSRNFPVVLFGSLAAYNIDIPEDLKALIIVSATGLFTALTVDENVGQYRKILL
jgi:hypothetical protein